MISNHRRRERVNALRNLRREQGLCLNCGQPSVAGRAKCEHHLESARRRRKAKGRKSCNNCSKPPLPGRAYCESCFIRIRNKFEQARQERESMGLCLSCGKLPPSPNRSLCQPCLDLRRDKAREYRQTRLAAGLCVRCGKTGKLPHSSNCEVCFFKDLSNQTFGTVVEGEPLRNLFWANGGRCVYSNLPLTFGLDATLDHIVPVAKGGTDTIDNVQFVHSMANQMKWSYLESEFLGFIKAIYEHKKLQD